jgi:glycosyltransferase involved in cell wall biosynthesis
LSGCALVLGDIPSLREIWGDDAWFVPPDDPSRLADAIRTLVHSPTLRNEMARRASARARRYTPERMAAQYAAAYDSMVQDGARQAPAAEALSF